VPADPSHEPDGWLDARAFRVLASAAPDAILVVDGEGHVRFANTQATTLFGYDATEFAALQVQDLVPERFRAAHEGHRSGFMNAPSSRPMGRNLDLFARRKGGSEFPAEISLSPLQNHGVAAVQVVVRDVTETRAQRDRLREAQQTAEKASLAKSEFLASMSHELRTPLNSILGFAQLLGRDRKEPLSERHRGMVDHIVRSGQHLLRLIDEVLDLSRIEAGRVSVSLEPVSVKSVLAEVTATLSPLALARRIDLLATPLENARLEVTADRTRFAQVLLNFGTNAIKYGRSGGRVRFRVTRTAESLVRVLVEDDGPGIAPEHHPRIFEPFQRAGQEGGSVEGTGIGLAIVKRLAMLMKGSTGFNSAPGQGSTFWIELPEVVSSVGLSKEKDAATSAARATPRELRVLYVEDNEANVALMRAVLADRGSVHLECRRTAEEGIETAVTAQQGFDLVILDIHLPGISGVDAARVFLEHPATRNIPLVALSASAMPAERALAKAAGFSRYLTKPLDVGLLEALLDEVATGPS
jgi:PAS domain S-box-containing protein